MDTLNPIQILPALPNWRAAFVNPDTKEIVERPVVAWALCAQSGHDNAVHGIVHLDGKMVPVGDCSNFVGYLEPGITRDQYLGKRVSP